MANKPLISDELAGFLESGLSVHVGSRDGELQPAGAIAWAVRVHDDRAHLTLYMHKGAAEAMLRNLRVHPEIAVDFDRPTSHRACQVKGRFVATRAAKASERPAVERQVDCFFEDLELAGIPRALFAGYTFWPCVAIEMRATDLFEQTPGPGTGERLQ